MDSLPQELTDHISSYLSIEDLKNSLKVSPAFQIAAERFSGAFDEFELNKENGSKFINLFGGRRLGYLRHLSFRTQLPPLDDEIDLEEELEKHGDCLQIRDTFEEVQNGNKCFTDQIRFLFSTIKEVEDRAHIKHGGRVRLTIYSPTRFVRYDDYHTQRAYVSWRVKLLKPESLPNLTSVRALRVENGLSWGRDQWDGDTLRKLDLRVLVDLSKKLLNLEDLECYLGGDEYLSNNKNAKQRYVTKDWAGPRRDTRHEFAQTLGRSKLETVRDARLNFIAPLECAHDFDLLEPFPNLVSPGIYDLFSSKLREFSYHLRKLSLTAILDHTFFWPTDGNEAIPSWPNLEVLNVTFHIVTPSGEWYFNPLQKAGSKTGYTITKADYPPYEEVDPDLDDVDELDWNDILEEQNRVVPNEDTLIPLLRSFSRATTNMSRLKQALLWAPLDLSVSDDVDIRNLTKHAEERRNGFGPLAWGLIYTSPDAVGLMDSRGKKNEDKRQIWWKVADWRPDPALHAMITSIGQERYGTELLEHWDDDVDGTGLAGRYEIERFEDQLFDNEWPSDPRFA